MATHFLAGYMTGEPEFKPEPWYNEYGDCVQCLCANEAVIADRIDGIFTLYRSAIDDRVIGFQVKGITALMDLLGCDKAAVAAKTRQGKVVSVMLLILAALKRSEMTATRKGLEAYGSVLQALEPGLGLHKQVELLEPANC